MPGPKRTAGSPLVRAPQSDPRHSGGIEEASADLRGYSIMVVDDHDYQRGHTLHLLANLGAEAVLEAASGSEVLTALAQRAEPVDIVLCDLDMPDMDGVELIRHLAERRLTRAIAIMSAMEPAILNTTETMARAYGLQVLCTLAKPITGPSLQRCLDAFQRTPVPAPAHATPPRAFGRHDLEGGLERGEFVAFFQPKVCLESGDLCGVEALARWRHPEQGLLAPYRFIDQMEQEGLAADLADAMLRQSCALLAAGGAAAGVTASVNVAISGLADRAVADRLLGIVGETSCRPQQIVLEVTETAILKDVAAVLHVLARLRLKGFLLSIDDFGTGYSSLQQLSNGPFTELKIDRSFVSGAPTQARNRSIIEASLDLARRLGLSTVAEGVETLDEWRLLASMGCHQAQGYFIARPMPASELAAWMRAWRAPPPARGGRS